MKQKKKISAADRLREGCLFADYYYDDGILADKRRPACDRK